MAWTLCSKADVIAFQPVSSGDLQDIWSDIAETMVKDHIGAAYYGTSEAIADETHDGDGTNVLIVKHPPIISVSSLSISDNAYTSTDYEVFGTHVELLYQTFTKGVRNISISYTSGATTVANDIKLATISIILAFYNYYGRLGSDASIKWGELEQGLGAPTSGFSAGLYTHIQTILKLLTKRLKLRIK